MPTDNDPPQINQEIVFMSPDGYPDRGRFLRMDNGHYLLIHRVGTLAIPPERFIAVVRPKPAAYSERPVLTP